MPLYESECENCNKTFEHISKIADREKARCPICGFVGKLLISTRNRDWFRPNEMWEDFGDRPIEVTSKKHLRQLCEQHGVYSLALD